MAMHEVEVEVEVDVGWREGVETREECVPGTFPLLCVQSNCKQTTVNSTSFLSCVFMFSHTTFFSPPANVPSTPLKFS